MSSRTTTSAAEATAVTHTLSNVAVTARILSIGVLPFLMICGHGALTKLYYNECKSNMLAVFFWENARYCHLLNWVLQASEKAMWCYAIAIAKDIRFIFTWVFNVVVPDPMADNVEKKKHNSHQHHE
jgi:hypothetical protein